MAREAMIERQKDLNNFAVTCDGPGCTEDIEIETEDFEEAVKEIHEAGWESFKDEDGDWQNRCPACVEGSNRKRGLEEDR